MPNTVRLRLLLALALTLAGIAATPADPLPVKVARVLALEPDLENGRFVYQLCADCHTPQGWGQPDGTVPVISGQHRGVLVKQLEDIREGLRGNDSMFPFAKDEAIGGDQAIADVTGYISRLLMPAVPVRGSGKRLETGARLYRETCSGCHGSSGEGDADRLYPRLQGQHYPYLLRQLERMLSGERANANPGMMAVLASLDATDREAVSDYLSRIRPPAALVAPEGWENPDFNYGIQ